MITLDLINQSPKESLLLQKRMRYLKNFSLHSSPFTLHSPFTVFCKTAVKRENGKRFMENAWKTVNGSWKMTPRGGCS